MNWGWKITLVYVAFAAMMISFVIRAKQYRVDLVSADYYEQELNYEQRMDAIKNTNRLAEQPSVKLVDKNIVVQFPASFAHTSLSGTVHFYSPSDSRLDKSFNLELKPSMSQQISMAGFARGSFIAKLNWTAIGEDFYYEQPLLIH